MNCKIIPLLFIFISVLSCTTEGETPSTLGFPTSIKSKTFEINTPNGWELVEDQGYDTYIGRIKNDEFTIFFDQGHLSFGTLDIIKENEETLFFQRIEINGDPAIVHKEKLINDPSNETILSVFIDSGEKQNRLYVLDSDNDAFFIELFKTHKFLD